MNEEIRDLEPKELWNKFADLNAVPRPSKKEERVIAFMKDFGKKLNLETIEDEVGNVIIRKPAWVRAKGTTLGADNGLGVATIMAILESNTIEHPALEALFTIDEETGMTGAKGLKGGILQGDILLNLDTEEDNEIGVGCAGGVDITATKTYSEEEAPANTEMITITVKGLQGGHSGMDIIKGLGNANKLMNRVLYTTQDFIHIASVAGGSLRNAIPRESVAVVAVTSDKMDAFKAEVETITNKIKEEYKNLEPELSITTEKKSEVSKKVMDGASQKEFIQAIYAAHNGVYRMSPEIEDLVETSNNIAKITVEKGNIEVLCLTRSSVESSKDDLANTLQAVFEMAGFKVEFSGEYPGWAPNMESSIVKLLDSLYEEMNGERAEVAACHAGLECGILGQNYPEMEMISFGPTIRGAHSPDERASISSAQKYWKFVLEALKRIPKK